MFEKPYTVPGVSTLNIEKPDSLFKEKQNPGGIHHVRRAEQAPVYTEQACVPNIFRPV